MVFASTIAWRQKPDPGPHTAALDRDLVGQLTGNTGLAVGANGGQDEADGPCGVPGSAGVAPPPPALAVVDLGLVEQPEAANAMANASGNLCRHDAARLLCVGGRATEGYTSGETTDGRDHDGNLSRPALAQDLG